jgi:hypothetical protein
MKNIYLCILAYLFLTGFRTESSTRNTNAPEGARLTGLNTTLGVPTTSVSPSQTEYYLRNAESTESTVRITPTLSNLSATMQISINGGTSANLENGQSSDPLPLNVGDNTITLIVSASGNLDITYKIFVHRNASSNANLSSVTTSVGDPTSELTQLQSQYFLPDVAFSQTSVSVTAHLSDMNASMQIRINSGTYTALASGTSSAALPLNVGENIIDILVTAQNQTTRTYSFMVRKNASSNANLSAVTTSVGDPTSELTQLQSQYFLPDVAFSQTSVSVTAHLSDMNASMQIRINSETYTALTSGTSSAALPLNVGENIIDILVTAQNQTTRTYSFMVRKNASSNANLSAVTTSVGDPTSELTQLQSQYFLPDVAFSQTSVSVTAHLSDINASMQIRINSGTYTALASGTSSAALPLNVGENIIDILVTAQNQTTRTYSFMIRKNRFTDTDLSELIISEGSLTPTFSPEVLEYTMNVPHSTTSIKMTPSLANTGAIMEIKINDGEYITLQNNTESDVLPLIVGENTILIRITLPDAPSGRNARVAEVTQVYELIVTRNNPLPVTLIAFNGKKSGTAQAVLKWVTADEKDFFAFEIQKSNDAKSFEKVGEITAKQANGSHLNTYTFYDDNAANSEIYYRLKMIDTDKSFTFSRIISINNNEAETGVVGEFYPNPVLTEKVSIDIVTTESGKWKISAFDMLGTERHLTERELSTGENKVFIPTLHLKSGINLIKFENNGKAFVRKIIRL